MTQPPPSPVRFFETITGYQRTAALKAAVELALFTAIGAGNRSVAALAERCSASERGVRILCDYLVIAGFLTKSGAEYGLTADSATFLDRKSPAYIGAATDFIASPALIELFLADPAEIVRRGGTLPGEGSVSPDNPPWVAFPRAMAPLVAQPRRDVAARAHYRRWRPVADAFSFVMLGSTRAGDAYTFAEYRRMFETAGFADLALHELPPTDERVVTARRA